MKVWSKFTMKQKGIILMLLSSFFMSAMQIFIKFSAGRIPVMEQIFARSFVTALMCIPPILKSKASFLGEKKNQLALFGRSFFGFLGFITLFVASNNANQSDVAVLTKMTPFIVTILAAILLKEKISKVQIPAMIIAFGGAFMVANPSFNSNTWPLVVAFATSITSGIAYTLLSYFKGKENTFTVVMHFSVFSSLACIPFMLFDFVVPTFTELCWLILIGLFGGAGQITLTYAYQMAPAAEVSIYNYSGIIFTMIFSCTIIGEGVSFTSVIGGVLVTAASLLVYFYNNSKKHLQQEAEQEALQNNAKAK